MIFGLEAAIDLQRELEDGGFGLVEIVALLAPLAALGFGVALAIRRRRINARGGSR